MKIYQHIVNNRPFCYAVGRDEDEAKDLKEFIASAERYSRGTFTQLEDRCEDNIDFYSTDGSLIHVITIPSDMVARNS